MYNINSIYAYPVSVSHRNNTSFCLIRPQAETFSSKKENTGTDEDFKKMSLYYTNIFKSGHIKQSDVALVKSLLGSVVDSRTNGEPQDDTIERIYLREYLSDDGTKKSCEVVPESYTNNTPIVLKDSKGDGFDIDSPSFLKHLADDDDYFYDPDIVDSIQEFMKSQLD